MQILNAITPVCSNITWAGKYAYIYNASKNYIYLKMAIELYLENLQHSELVSSAVFKSTVFFNNRLLMLQLLKSLILKMSFATGNQIIPLLTESASVLNSSSIRSHDVLPNI
jgi:hypothetical protein